MYEYFRSTRLVDGTFIQLADRTEEEQPCPNQDSTQDAQITGKTRYPYARTPADILLKISVIWKRLKIAYHVKKIKNNTKTDQ
ncbi:hypothetical protein HNY73_010509 [Argiope bruennichi]|uniref:Uncharacterized protein n=1 Tax=Argiope bruennichi TaxID=94029 RepID=A0A8T0F1D0_ARGBR|nr:hypothetical protein HNY73_010509 [Argiope bruennichi]